MPNIELCRELVLDTHAWVWASAGDERSASLRPFRGRPVVSAISVWEVAMLEQRGRLSLLPNLETWVERNLSAPVVLEPLLPAISLAGVRLEDFHGDPADRMIVATAQQLGIPLVTADSQILKWAQRHSLLTIPL